MITSPGRFQLIVPDVASIGVGAYPDVLTPAFVVPSSIPAARAVAAPADPTMRRLISFLSFELHKDNSSKRRAEQRRAFRFDLWIGARG